MEMYLAPPMIISKGKCLKLEFEVILPAGTLDWAIRTVYLTFIKVTGPNPLVFDGTAAHLDYRIMEDDKHNIAMST